MDKNKRKMYIWGTGHIEEAFEQKCVLNGFLLKEFCDVGTAIEGYIDTYKNGTYKGKKIYKLDEIDINNSYIIVAVHDYYPIKKQLYCLGLQYGRDYICISQKYDYQEIQNMYFESYNRISGDFVVETLEVSECSDLIVGEETKIGKNVCIVMSGFSKLTIGARSFIGDNVLIRCENGGHCFIGEDVRVNSESEIICYGGSTISVSNGCVLPTKLFVSGKSDFSMGEGSDFDINTNVRVLNGSRVDIGNDSMFSYDISIRGEDGHALINLIDGSIIERPKSVTIGNHVWIGMRSIILPGAKVGDGSIIGAGSIVNKVYAPNVEIVGVPGKVVREQVSWDRKPPNFLS